MKSSAVMKEVAVMKKLHHEYICRLLHHEEKDHNHFLFLELATGGELFTRVINSGNLTEDEAGKYFGQLMSAVSFMHSQGIVHRDLKLENVLLDGQDCCKVCDFGLAHMYEMGKDSKPIVVKLHEVCGSKSYCAPEVLEGLGYDGFPMDVWSCGICLFCMLGGFFPLDEATGADWRFERVKMACSQGCSAAHTIFGFYERECPLSKACTDLIDGCLSINPVNRLTIEQVLNSPWLTKGTVSREMDVEVVPPSYRGINSKAANMTREQLMAVLAEEQPQSPVYRGGPALGPPPMLARQPCKFCADFHIE
jgi:serine/threonine protein kinase